MKSFRNLKHHFSDTGSRPPVVTGAAPLLSPRKSDDVFKVLFLKCKMILILMLVFVVSLSSINNVFAKLSKRNELLFSQNNIMFYDPSDRNDGCKIRTGEGSNLNYAGEQVWSDAELEAIAENQAIYEEAANKFGFPWQILAVIHSNEMGLLRANPENGQGVYMLYEYTEAGAGPNRFAPAGPISEDEFRRQTLIAAEIIGGMAGDLNKPDGVKRLFFMYNGLAKVFFEKAAAMGFSEEEAAVGEASTYVMNRYDARRDPTSSEMDPNWPGRYVADGVYDPSSTTMVFGSFVKYEALGGVSGVCYGGAGGGIAETAILLSWEGHGHDKSDPKPEYEQAMKEIGAYTAGCNGSGCAPIGASCDQFVGTVMRYSGADTEFPVFGPPVQEEYMKSHPDMYMEVEHNEDVANLEPGDILVTTNNGNHIYLYVGEVDGQPTQASASFNDRTGEHFAGVYFSDNGGARVYKVYRRINY